MAVFIYITILPSRIAISLCASCTGLWCCATYEWQSIYITCRTETRADVFMVMAEVTIWIFIRHWCSEDFAFNAPTLRNSNLNTPISLVRMRHFIFFLKMLTANCKIHSPFNQVLRAVGYYNMVCICTSTLDQQWELNARFWFHRPIHIPTCSHAAWIKYQYLVKNFFLNVYPITLGVNCLYAYTFTAVVSHNSITSHNASIFPACNSFTLTTLDAHIFTSGNIGP